MTNTSSECDYEGVVSTPSSPGRGDVQDFFRQRQPAAVFKHGILRRYLVPWAQKTGSTSDRHRVVVVDGYAGAGLYEDGSHGSPILIAEIARLMQRERQVDLVLVEKDPATHAQLVANLERNGFRLDYSPLCGRLEDHLDAVLEYAEGVPTFVFLDPYGMGLPYEVVTQRILGTVGNARPKTEILLNFTADAVRRIGGLLHSARDVPGRDATLKRMDATCGGVWWRALIKPGEPDVAELVVNEYASRLSRDTGTITLVAPVRRGPRLKPVYFLIHATRHRDGLYLMIDHISLAGGEWRQAADTEETLFTSGGTTSFAEQQLSAAWVSSIKTNVATLTTRTGRFIIGDHIADVFGSTLGEARWTHVRTALKELAKEHVIAPVSAGKVWTLSVSPATPPLQP